MKLNGDAIFGAILSLMLVAVLILGYNMARVNGIYHTMDHCNIYGKIYTKNEWYTCNFKLMKNND